MGLVPQSYVCTFMYGNDPVVYVGKAVKDGPEVLLRSVLKSQLVKLR